MKDFVRSLWLPAILCAVTVMCVVIAWNRHLMGSVDFAAFCLLLCGIRLNRSRNRPHVANDLRTMLADAYLFIGAIVLDFGWPRWFEGANAYAVLCLAISGWIRVQAKAHASPSVEEGVA